MRNGAHLCRVAFGRDTTSDRSNRLLGQEKLTVKRTLSTWLPFLLVIGLGACSEATPDAVEGMIGPDDAIDGMRFSTMSAIDWDISLAFLCDWESAEEAGDMTTVSCFAPPGGRVFFGNCDGVGGDSADERDEAWQDIDTRVTFDGQKVNLPAFGFLDDAGEGVRFWNVVVEGITPGTHTIECEFERDDESRTGRFVFTVSDQAEAYPTVSAEALSRMHPYSSEVADLEYLLYLPDAYGVDPQETWPLLVYLHGMDRVNKSVEVLRNAYPLSTLADNGEFPFIVVAPQGTGEFEFWARDEMVDAITDLLDEIQGVLLVDPNRVYLTGESAGGNGTWSIGVRHPERFAALAPMMGYFGWPPTVPENICGLATTPVWAFHGADDDVVPLEAEQQLVNSLRECGGDVRFTVFPDTGHDLDARNVYTQDLYQWLMEQSLAR